MRAFLLLFASLALLSSPLAAQSLAQLRLEGAIALDGPGKGGGGYVEIEIGALVDGEARELEVHLFLGPGTTGAELCELVGRRLAAARFPAILVGSGDGGRSLFVDDTLFLRVRVEGGLVATVTSCAGAPTSLRIVPPPEGAEPALLGISAGTRSPRGGVLGKQRLDLGLAAGSHPTRVAEQLASAAIEAGWMADRPRGDLWRAAKMRGGEAITGLSVRLKSPSGWRLEVDLRVE